MTKKNTYGKKIVATLLIVSVCLVMANAAQAKVWFGAEACTKQNSCGGSSVSESYNDYSVHYSPNFDSSSSCDNGVGYVNVAVAGSAEMCTAGDNHCRGCSVTKPESDVEDWIAIFGDGSDSKGQILLP